MATKGAVKVDGESIQVDTKLLFQQLIITAKTDLEIALTYELTMAKKKPEQLALSFACIYSSHIQFLFLLK